MSPTTSKGMLVYLVAFLLESTEVKSFVAPGDTWMSRQTPSKITSVTDLDSSDQFDHQSEESRGLSSLHRRELLSWGVASAGLTLASQPACAARQKKLYLVRGRNVTATEVGKEPVKVETKSLSSEECLLKLLPVKNPVFRTLEKNIRDVSALQTSSVKDTDAWKNAQKNAEAALKLLDSKRSKLEPVFNPEDNSLMQITKAERGEQLIETFRKELVSLIRAIFETNKPATFEQQRVALLALSEIGELMVEAFPYEVPAEGKFSFLPRLLGRTVVTFRFRRGKENLGNVTMIADGYAAPITAGNFVDLCNRQFYTGLPVKIFKKKLGITQTMMGSFKEGGLLALENEIIETERATPVPMPILGSFQEEGFYDPLTAKPRRIPLEILRLDKSTGLPKLSYSPAFWDLPDSEASLGISQDNRPVLNFDIPGLVAFNHPDKNADGGSSEFFSLQEDLMTDEMISLLNGQYAPFGYIVGGYELYQTLKAGDVIDATTVNEWGLLNLVKIRGTSFTDVLQGGGDKE